MYGNRDYFGALLQPAEAEKQSAGPTWQYSEWVASLYEGKRDWERVRSDLWARRDCQLDRSAAWRAYSSGKLKNSEGYPDVRLEDLLRPALGSGQTVWCCKG